MVWRAIQGNGAKTKGEHVAGRGDVVVEYKVGGCVVEVELYSLWQAIVGFEDVVKIDGL